MMDDTLRTESQMDPIIDEVNAELDDQYDAPADHRELGRQDNGSFVVLLVTDGGSEKITVPPIGRWKSSARNALFTRGDDAAWAVTTLSPDDVERWMSLDPTKDEAEEFIADFYRLAGQNLGESRASRRSSTRTRGR
jgi:hypothetical protein